MPFGSAAGRAAGELGLPLEVVVVGDALLEEAPRSWSWDRASSVGE